MGNLGNTKSINLLCSKFNQAIKICSFFLITQFNWFFNLSANVSCWYLGYEKNEMSKTHVNAKRNECVIYKLRCNRVILSRVEWWVNHLLNDYDEKCSTKDDLLRWDIWQRNYTSFELFIPCFIQKLDVCIFLMFCQVL